MASNFASNFAEKKWVFSMNQRSLDADQDAMQSVAQLTEEISQAVTLKYYSTF